MVDTPWMTLVKKLMKTEGLKLSQALKKAKTMYKKK